MRERSTFTSALSVTNTPTLLSLGAAAFMPTTSRSARITAPATFSTLIPYPGFDAATLGFAPAFLKSHETPP
jgi:hypothetical protein